MLMEDLDKLALPGSARTTGSQMGLEFLKLRSRYLSKSSQRSKFLEILMVDLARP
jgi:hypothetical protein